MKSSIFNTLIFVYVLFNAGSCIHKNEAIKHVRIPVDTVDFA